MKNFVGILFYFGFLGGLFAGEVSSEIVTAIGHTYTLPVKRYQQVYLANSAIAKVRDKKTHLKITGKKIGTTNLFVGNKKYDLVVLAKPTYFQYHSIAPLIDKITGLQLKVYSQCLYITGELLKVEDFWKIQKRVNRKKNKFCDRNLSWKIIINPLIYTNWNIQLINYLKLHNLESCSIKPDKKQANHNLAPKEHIHLVCPDNLVKQQISILHALGIPHFLNSKALSSHKQILVELNIFETDKKKLNNLGIQWPDQLSIENKAITVPSLSLHLLEQDGSAKILSSPQILSSYNEKIHFQSGGEIPIKMISENQQKVTWKKYGLLFNANIKPLFEKQVHIDFQIELSAPDYSSAIDGVPGFFLNQTKHQMNLPINKSIIIAGLNKEQWRHNQNALSSFSNIPIIGEFFKNNSKQKNSSLLNISISIKEISWTK